MELRVSASRALKCPSIVLIGMRGTGKSTLAVITASRFDFTYIEFRSVFKAKTGQSEAGFISSNTPAEYKRKEHEILTALFDQNPYNTVIVCGPTCVDSEENRSLIKLRSKDLLVIHIACEEQRVYDYLKFESIDSKFRDVWVQRINFFRSVANHEFFNRSKDMNGGDSLRELPSFLALKSVFNDFTKFITFILFGPQLKLSRLKLPEYASHSCSLPIRYPRLLGNDPDFDELITGADLIELIFDLDMFLNKATIFDDIARIWSSARHATNYLIPFVFAIESVSKDANLYHQLLLFGLSLGAEYVSFDLSYLNSRVSGGDDQFHANALKTLIKQRNHSKIIGSWSGISGSTMPVTNGNHTPERKPNFWTSPEPLLIYEAAANIGCNIVRISQQAQSINENFQVIQFLEQIRAYPNALPICAYNTGTLGIPSKIFNNILTPISPPLPIDNRIFGELSCRELHQSLHHTLALPARKFYIFGRANTHSLSPIMHNSGFQALGLPYTYEIYESTHWDQFRLLTTRIDFGGMSVSMPYKETVLDFIDEISFHAKIIGAVNTVVPKERNALVKASEPLRLYGDNTDWIGVHAAVDSHLSPINTISNRTVGVIIGAGGMARAAIYSLIRMGVPSIFIMNRTFNRAHRLAEYFNRQTPLQLEDKRESIRDFKVHVIQDNGELPEGTDPPTIIINCLPGKDLNGDLVNVKIPDKLYGSRTGGVYVEVSAFCVIMCSEVLTKFSAPITRRSPHYLNKHGPICRKDGLLFMDYMFYQNKLTRSLKFGHRKQRRERLCVKLLGDILNSIIGNYNNEDEVICHELCLII